MFKVITNNKYCPDNRLVVSGVDYSSQNVNNWYALNTGAANMEFNRRIYELFPNRKLYILDIGCGHCNFVRDCLKDGHYALGLDGFYILDKYKPGNWNVLQDNLYTCDVSHEFEITYNNQPVLFDILTSFEFLEHLYEEDVDGVMKNIYKFLSPTGFTFHTVATTSDYGHFCVKPKEWWAEKFNQHGFIDCPEMYAGFHNNLIRNESTSMTFILKKA